MTSHNDIPQSSNSMTTKNTLIPPDACERISNLTEDQELKTIITQRKAERSAAKDVSLDEL